MRNGLLLLVSFPFLKVGLEGSLVVESHCAETRPFEVEVKIHVVLLRSLLMTLLLLRVQFCICFLELHLSGGLDLRLLLLIVRRGLCGSCNFFMHLTCQQFLGAYFLFECSFLQYLFWRLADFVRIV